MATKAILNKAQEHTKRIRHIMRTRNCRLEFLALTGSHLWGLETEQSDIDLRGVFGWNANRALCLFPGRDNYEAKKESGLDYQVYEYAKALKMLLGNNGNLVELFLSPYTLYRTDWGEKMGDIARRCITKALSKYYLGYATGQRKRAFRNRGGKALIYTYREIFAGIWLMHSGEIIFNFPDLIELVWRQWGPFYTLRWAMQNRFTPAGTKIMEAFEEEWNELVHIFKGERDGSSLPEYPPGELKELCNALMLAYRISRVKEHL